MLDEKETGLGIYVWLVGRSARGEDRGQRQRTEAQKVERMGRERKVSGA